MTIVIILLIMTYVLNIIDYLQTIYAVNLFGLRVEANPLARFFFENDCAWAPKLIAVPIILTLIGIIVKYNKWLAWVVYVLFVFYLAVIAHNFSQLVLIGALNFE